jgi:hypothetical protein
MLAYLRIAVDETNEGVAGGADTLGQRRNGVVGRNLLLEGRYPAAYALTVSDEPGYYFTSEYSGKAFTYRPLVERSCLQLINSFGKIARKSVPSASLRYLINALKSRVFVFKSVR